MIPKLTEDAVSRLPIEAGRAELLEEIMSTVAPDRQTAEPTAPSRHRARWLVPLAVAATVASVASAPLWWGGGDQGGPEVSYHAAVDSPGTGYRAVLTAPGWQVESTEEDSKYGGEVVYDKGGQQLAITWYPEESYQDYLLDRQHIVESPLSDTPTATGSASALAMGESEGTSTGSAPTGTTEGDPVTVLGVPGHLWAYTEQDHTVMREPQLDHWMEFRGQGMDRVAFEELLTQLKLVSLAEFESALPSSFATAADRPAAIQEILSGIEEVTGATVPAGTTLDTTSDEQDPYQLGAEISGQYACAWIAEFADAKGSGDQGRADEAARVMGTSRQWPILNQMNADGDYPEVVWEYADTMAGGQVPQHYREGLGCP